MTPSEIITRELSKIKGLRIGLIKHLGNRILEALSEEGFIIVDEYEYNKFKKGA